MKQTPTDVLENMYRQALSRADALGVSLRAALSEDDPDLAIELAAYVRDEYGMEI